MNDLLNTKLVGLLSDTSLVENEEMHTAYENFKEQIVRIQESEQDFSEIFRTLNITRIELVTSQTLHRYEQGGKCPEICLYSKGFSPC